MVCLTSDDVNMLLNRFSLGYEELLTKERALVYNMQLSADATNCVNKVRKGKFF